jgi:hypothetical protein
MPCMRAEQPLSRSALEDTGVPAPMEIMMAGSPEDICLFACSPQSPGDTWQPRSCPEPGGGARAVGTRSGPRASPSREQEPVPRGHMVAPELPRAGSGSPCRGDTWWSQSCAELGAGARAAGTHDGLGAALSREAGAVVLT